MTVSGRYFDPMDPERYQNNVRLGDIAHALGQIHRFNGHTVRPIPVDEHSLRVERIAARLVARLDRPAAVVRLIRAFALLHDAAEAYIGDIVRPMKTDDMRLIEGSVLDTITAALLRPLLDRHSAEEIGQAWSTVHHADSIALYFEAMLWQPGASDWAPDCIKGVADPLEFLPDIWPRRGESWLDTSRAAVGSCRSRTRSCA